ncbi:MAG: type II toxin-antitoxin system PemK/MazF family toxin [Solirubrobacterales bacterium]
MTRGDVVRLPARRRARGHEQRGSRYGVVVQSDDFAELSTCLVAPTSRSVRPTSFRPLVTVAGTATRVLVEQLRATDLSDSREPVGHLSRAEMVSVDDALRVVLGLDQP